MRQKRTTLGSGIEVPTVEDLIGKRFSYKNAFLAAVYVNPVDFPDHVICRLMVMNKPTPYYLKRGSVDEIHHEFKETGATWFERADGDDKELVGAYYL